MGLSLEMFSAISVCLLMVIMILRRKSAERRKLHLPPSPPGRPIIGHLHILQLPLHQTLHKLAQKYGPFFYIKMGSSSAVVVSSPDWSKEFLHTHDREFADRPQFEASKRLLYNNKTMIMMEYSPTWIDLRKLYTVQILSAKRIEMFENARRDEMAMLMKLIRRQASISGGAAVDLRKLVFNTLGNMMTKMLFSKRSFDVTVGVDGRESRFKQMVEEMGILFGTPVLGDLIPWLSWLDLQGCKKKMDNLAKELDAFFEDVVAQRIERRGISEANEDADSDYLDLLLRIYNKDGKVDKESIKCILLDLLSAGAETSSTTIEWALAELMKNPDSMKKLQEELDTLVAEHGALNMTSECIKDADIAKLSYLQAVVKETLRLHPPFSINLRQMCKDFENGIQVRGYDLLKKTRVLFNLWTMGRDTASWGANADTFYPDRFLSGGSVPDLRGQHFEFLPFGTGRRGCPGMNMALTMVPFVVANLVQVFDWKMPNGVYLDLSEAAAFTTPMAKPLVAIPVLRTSS